MKKFFNNSRLGIGVAVGTAIGYFMNTEGDGASGVFIAAAVVMLLAVIVERMFFRK